jgi:hypothetical protein
MRGHHPKIRTAKRIEIFWVNIEKINVCGAALERRKIVMVAD